MLERFKVAKASEIELLTMQAKDRSLPTPWKGVRPNFLQAIKRSSPDEPPAIIAEFKQASPSCGVIALGLRPEEVARQYAEAGATCISVLTEEEYFQGHLSFLHQMQSLGLPLLRKDFIFHPLQVIETISTPASGMLLIVRLTPDATLLRQLREQAESFGIHSIVEIFDEEDLKLARESGARIIQVNARDLSTFETDRQACLDLVKLKRDDEVWIAASAMDCASHVKEAQAAGYDAVLIGTALMKEGKPGEALQKIVSEL